jgi:small subunit ribosomal protein S2
MSEIDHMFEAGVHYGYSRTRRHPTTAPFIYTTKNRIDIINLEDTEAQLEKAKAFVKELKASGKNILWVGIKPEAQKVIEETALTLGMPYVNERWVGGTLTNWVEIKRRVNELNSLKEKKANGELEKYTKKERLLIDRSIAKMEKNFSGISAMTRLPDAAIVIDPKREYIAMEELNKAGIPIITLANTDCNLTGLKYPIVGNDGSRSSVTYIVNALKEAYKA